MYKRKPDLSLARIFGSLVYVHVKKDKVFTRSGDDLKLTVPVSFSELVLGGAVTVPTLDSRVRVRIPQGTADGTTLRVRGRGVLGGVVELFDRIKCNPSPDVVAPSLIRY